MIEVAGGWVDPKHVIRKIDNVVWRLTFPGGNPYAIIAEINHHENFPERGESWSTVTRLWVEVIDGRDEITPDFVMQLMSRFKEAIATFKAVKGKETTV